jgi:tetrahydromethanopterin S-methyltransferase subunit G
MSMAMDVEAEIRDLQRRVGELEGSFGFLTGQVRDVHRALLTFQAETKNEFKNVNGRLDNVEGRLDRVETEVRGLRRDMPGIVGDAVRDALRERPGKPRKPS